ncbi:hypothetical protein P3342_003374 [Pyrenophora teres f. teres]|nr:hypothetical protein P3342_003374 [Pyrenophora teres f. teres]
MRVTNKLTAHLSVVPAANTKDAALEKLQNDLAKVASKGRDEADQAISFINVDEDPELRRQREEATFKEKQRQLRAREKHEARQAERANRTMGRTGGRGTGGLDIDGLEDRPARKQQARREVYGVIGAMMKTTVVREGTVRTTMTRRMTSSLLVTRNRRSLMMTMTQMKALGPVRREEGAVLQQQTMTTTTLWSVARSGDVWLMTTKMKSSGTHHLALTIQTMKRPQSR